MDYTSFQEFMNSPSGPYIVFGTVGLVGGVFGYIVGRVRGRKKLERIRMSHLERMAGLEVKKGEGEVQLKKEANSIELAKLEYAEKERVYQREKEVSEIEYQRKLEQDKVNEEKAPIKHERLLELQKNGQEEAEKNRAYKLELVQKLAGELKPIMESYVNAIKENATNDERLEQDEQLLKARKTYRDDLFEKLEEELEDNYSISDEDYDISEEEIERIDRLVDAKHPIQGTHNNAPKMPKEISELIKIVSGELAK